MEENLKSWFSLELLTTEKKYLAGIEPWQQSGFSGPYERWKRLRKPIADCINVSGTFLDIGCANGYLIECILNWTREREISITPYGLDISQQLINLAKQRLPKYRDNLFVGNALFWEPKQQFDYVRTELVYVPEEYYKEFISRILNLCLSEQGKLLVGIWKIK